MQTFCYDRSGLTIPTQESKYNPNKDMFLKFGQRGSEVEHGCKILSNLETGQFTKNKCVTAKRKGKRKAEEKARKEDKNKGISLRTGLTVLDFVSCVPAYPQLLPSQM